MDCGVSLRACLVGDFFVLFSCLAVGFSRFGVLAGWFGVFCWVYVFVFFRERGKGGGVRSVGLIFLKPLHGRFQLHKKPPRNLGSLVSEEYFEVQKLHCCPPGTPQDRIDPVN